MWLDGGAVLKQAGYTPASPLSAEQAAAVAFAEQAIATRTGLIWGETTAETLTVRLKSKTYYLKLPRDTRTVEDVTPAIGSSEMFALSHRQHLELFDAAWDQLAWNPGTYRVEVTRGITEIPEAVTRAAALLAGHHLTLADPDRSRFDNLALGDFSGTERRDAFPVPAAEQLLRPWIDNVRGALS